MRLCLCVSMCLLVLAPVFGQEPLAPSMGGEPPPESSGVWSGFIGLIFISAPKYEGAADRRLLALPIATAVFKHRLVFGPVPGGAGAGVSVALLRTKAWTWTGGMGLGESRPESRGDALAGMGDRGIGGFAATTVEYRHGMFQTSAGLGKHLNGGAGWSGTMKVGVQRRLGRWMPGAGVSLALADAKQMQYEFGVDGTQAARRSELFASGDTRLHAAALRAYSVGGGFRSASASATVGHPLSPKWIAIGMLSLSRLSGEAANSPLVSQRFHATSIVGVQYLFGAPPPRP